MKFKNRLNKEHKIDGKSVWESRSPAVVGVVIARHKNKLFVLVGKRGPGAPDNVGRWNVPCGYLDWDESGTEGITREIYEETDLNINDITEQNIFNNNLKQPFFVNTSPNENRQNVSLSYGLYFLTSELPKLSIKNCEPGESTEAKWLDIDEIDDYDFAFGHETRIRSYLNHIDK